MNSHLFFVDDFLPGHNFFFDFDDLVCWPPNELSAFLPLFCLGLAFWFCLALARLRCEEPGLDFLPSVLGFVFKADETMGKLRVFGSDIIGKKPFFSI